MTREQSAIRKRAKETVREIKKAKGLKKAEREAEAAKALRAAEKEIEAIEIKRTGNAIPQGLTCFVCGKAINTGAYRIIGYKGGEPYARHDACAPGTEAWMKSTQGQVSPYRKHFEVPRDTKPKGGDKNE
jgi:hypothetical protein